MSSSFRRFLLTYKRILKLVYEVNPSLLILITLINAFWGLTNLPVLYINKILIDLVIGNLGHPDWQNIAQTIVLVIAIRSLIEFLRSFFSRYNNALTNQLIYLINNHLDVALGEKLNSLDIPTIENPDFQDKYRKVTRESNTRVWGMISPISDIPNSFFTIMSGLIPLLQFNPLIGLLVIIVSLPETFINSRIARWDYRDRDKMNREYRLWNWLSYIISDTSQIYENKLYQTVDYVVNKLRKLQDYVFSIDKSMRMRRVKWRTLTDVPGWFLSVGLNSYFFILALMGKISIGLAQMLYQSSTTLANGFGMFTQNMAVIYENYLFVQDYTWFMDLKPQNMGGTQIFPAKLKTGIEFDHVWFKYPSSGGWILKDISLKITPLENVALVGENGAGKTTLLKLLLGFHVPNKGRILIDGVAVTDYDIQSLWKKVSVLQQDFHLFPFSARESIAFSDLSRVDNLDDIKSAAKLTDIDSYIESLSLKYNTPLTKELEKGVDPSGGQRQRIGLARALFHPSSVLVLDEPTSNVDPKAEEEIFENIIKITKNQILILVSHRFSTVRRANKIFVLDTGELVEAGTHEQLMKKKGLYAKLFTLQAKSYQ